MAVTILNGTLADGANGAWVAIPEKSLYTIANLAGLKLQVSNDGTNPTLDLTSGYLTGIDGAGFTAKLTVPFAYMRVINRSGSSITANVVLASA